MTEIFEYDVFISFASSDEEIVRPLWQALCSNGLRVFWSDANLKKELGNSWFDTIESSLERSRHLLLVCSRASMASKWVQREYKAFYQHCFQAGLRRLIPLLAPDFVISDLPLFLKELEAGRLDDPDFQEEIIPILGGVNIDRLRSENQLLSEKLRSLELENSLLKRDIDQLHKEIKGRAETASSPVEQACDEHLEDTQPAEALDKGENSHIVLQAKQKKAYDALGLPPEANSKEINERFEVAKSEYESLIGNSPKRLREICLTRLEEMQYAYDLVFPVAQAKEKERTELAYDFLQLGHEASSEDIKQRYAELKKSCQQAAVSSDQVVKRAAAEEIVKLDEVLSILLSETTASAAKATVGPLYSPVALRMAQSEGVSISDMSHIKGSGPGGRILRGDVEGYLQRRNQNRG